MQEGRFHSGWWSSSSRLMAAEKEIQKILDLCGIQGGPSAWLPNDAPNFKCIYQMKRVPLPCFVLVCVFLDSLLEDVEDKNLSVVMIKCWGCFC